MGLCTFIIAPAAKEAFDLDKGGWGVLVRLWDGTPKTLAEVETACIEAWSWYPDEGGTREEEEAYAREVAAKLFAFCERHSWQVEQTEDSRDLPWHDEEGWRCVAGRCPIEARSL